MIVTCEKCGARYKLDDGKVSGRGAKITCPRCKHMFVVFREEGAAPAAKPEAPPAFAPAPQPPPPPAGAPVRPPATDQVIPRAPRMPPGPPVTLAIVPGSKMPLPPPVAPVVPSRDVHGLDFRKVGIASWKVKVKIGLIYDFSDYKTLRKYIQEGRVTSADLLSSDGKNWQPIGEIPDLERHFIDVYEAAEKKKADDERVTAPSVNPFEDEAPTAVAGVADLALALPAGLMNDAVAQVTQEPRPVPTNERRTGPVGGPRSSDRVNTLTPEISEATRTRARQAATHTRPPQPAPRAVAAEKKSNLLPILGVIALVAVIGTWAWLNFGGGLQANNAIPAPSIETKAPPSAQPTSEEIRKQMLQELQAELEAAEPAQPINVEAEPKLIPVRPKDAQGNALRPVTPTSGSRTTPGTAPTASTQTERPMTARDHADAGDDAWRRGAYGEAAAAYRTATQLEPGNATWQGKLGRALYRSGDLSGATVALSAAERGGYVEAEKWLGHIARDQGDIAGAIGHYNEYLKSSPSDAADIQREIEKLTGS